VPKDEGVDDKHAEVWKKSAEQSVQLRGGAGLLRIKACSHITDLN